MSDDIITKADITAHIRALEQRVLDLQMKGLTKRELFAAMAMQGAMHALAIQADEFEDDEPVDTHPIARDAVRMADALLKELAK